ncbi:hypothetical protein RF55_24020 [Lasius niger]|uniref:Uncharacterized protein n=1 Tax=Lasius niger TaxID=67767 RepID=A0A0J7JWA6_LASNI|nr:hypothetical protein RF55_24020 [Lasius niger]
MPTLVYCPVTTLQPEAASPNIKAEQKTQPMAKEPKEGAKTSYQGETALMTLTKRQQESSKEMGRRRMTVTMEKVMESSVELEDYIESDAEKVESQEATQQPVEMTQSLDESDETKG